MVLSFLLSIFDDFLLTFSISHDRFEPDMLAFSGCYYGGGEKEMKELGAIRKRWKTLHVSPASYAMKFPIMIQKQRLEEV